MPYEISDTTDYHKRHLDTLGWELTVCNALDCEHSVCRRVLKRQDSYGRLLYDYLDRFVPLQAVQQVVEIGGGYGCLMRDFIERNNGIRATMIDLSPVLLAQQRLILSPSNASFVQADIMNVPVEELERFELAILNECLGDLPTLAEAPRDLLMSPVPLSDPVLEPARALLHRCAIDLPEERVTTVNIGALHVLEKLLRAGIPYVFISEHSCEAAAPEPWRHLIRLRPTGRPQRIPLRGHDEYTIRFSDLEAVARVFGYGSIRGPVADFLEFDFTDKLRYSMAAPSARTDEEEVVRHFIEDLYQYEYLILIAGRNEKTAG